MRQQGFVIQYQQIPLYMNPPSFSAYYLDLPWQIYIYDARIVGDTLYYCGRYADTTKQGAVIGYVSLTNALSLGSVRSDFKVFSNVFMLNKMIAYRPKGGNVHVLATGEATSTSSPGTMLVYVTHTAARIGNPSIVFLPAGEAINDLLMVNEKAVAVGTYNSILSLRIGAMDSIMSANPTFRSRHQYPHASDEANGSYYGAYVDDSTIAVSYVHIDASWREWARVRKFNIKTYANTSSFEFRIDSKEESISMRTMGKSKNLVLVHPYVDNTGTTNTDVYWIPYTLPQQNPSCRRYKFAQQWYGSAACVRYTTLTGGGFHETLMLNGGDHWYWQSNYLMSNGLFTSSLCTPSTQVSINIIPNLPRATILAPFLLSSLSSPCAPAYCNWTLMSPTVNCYTYF